jgi:hypothetical protein
MSSFFLALVIIFKLEMLVIYSLLSLISCSLSFSFSYLMVNSFSSCLSFSFLISERIFYSDFTKFSFLIYSLCNSLIASLRTVRALKAVPYSFWRSSLCLLSLSDSLEPLYTLFLGVLFLYGVNFNSSCSCFFF